MVEHGCRRLTELELGRCPPDEKTGELSVGRAAVSFPIDRDRVVGDCIRQLPRLEVCVPREAEPERGAGSLPDLQRSRTAARGRWMENVRPASGVVEARRLSDGGKSNVRNQSVLAGVAVTSEVNGQSTDCFVFATFVLVDFANRKRARVLVRDGAPIQLSLDRQVNAERIHQRVDA